MRKENFPGRPFKFNSIEMFQCKVDGYFEHCIDNDEVPDVEGLAVYLGMTRMGLLKYERRDADFEDSVRNAKEKIFHLKKQAAFKGKMNPTVFIFDAKNNHGYVDKQEVESKVIAEVRNDFDLSALTIEELRKLAQLGDGKGNSEEG
jgi:hypothetical protein